MLKVIEVNRPARQAERRLAGKSDTIDAEHAAREVLAGTATNIAKTRYDLNLWIGHLLEGAAYLPR